MNNEKLLKEIQYMVRVLPFCALPVICKYKWHTLPKPSISNILNNIHDDTKEENNK